MSTKKTEKVSYKQYGKPNTPLLNLKTSFFEENDLHIKKIDKIASVYKKQPKRTCCKNCDVKIDNTTYDFIKNGIEYILCENCNHLNGVYEDSSEFCDAVYIEDSGSDYSKNYMESDVDSYNYRTTSIYGPKAEFLYTSLMNNKINPHNLKYLDFGSGSGYFVSALRKSGLKNITGTEVSKTQVDYGNQMIGEDILNTHSMEDTHNILSKTKSNLVSMIGVLEHLQSPRKALKCLQENKNVEYLYISVPTFSLSVYLEIFADNIFHRQLSGGHTHLYTEESLSHLSQEFGFKIVSEWWFGTDLADLFRSLVIKSNYNNNTAKQKIFNELLYKYLDDLQNVLDKGKACSEVHIILAKK